MKKEDVKKFKVISHFDSNRFEDEVKELLLEHPDANISFGSIGERHNAYAIWRETIKVAENIRDEFVLRGEKHHCGECPFYGGNTDEPKNAFSCMREVYAKRRRCDEACMWLYQELAKGGIVLHDINGVD